MKSTINIIADDAAARDSWAQLLAVHGYETREYPDSMSYLERYGSPSDGCVLLDIRMPGMNGMDLQKELCRLGRNEPVVFVTGYGDVGLAVKAMKAGAVSFLQKPCAEDELIEAVQDALARKQDFQESKAAREKAGVAIARLTDREREVLGYVSKGMTCPYRKFISGRTGGVGRRELAVERCVLHAGPAVAAGRPWPMPGECGCYCNNRCTF